MTEPSLALQGAIVARLKADGDVTALLGARIYNAVPPNAVFPYLSWADDQVLDESTDCHDDVEVFTTLDVWARQTDAAPTPARVQAKRIAHAIRQSLNGAEFDLPDNSLILIEHNSTRVLTDPDGTTIHAVIVFRSLIQAVEPSSP